MTPIGTIAVRKLSELQSNSTISTINETTKLNKKLLKNNPKPNNRNVKSFSRTPQKNVESNEIEIKKRRRNAWKDPPCNQTRLESYFKICPKVPTCNEFFDTYDIKKRKCKRVLSETDSSKCETKTNINLSSECITISSESEEDNAKQNNDEKPTNKKSKTSKACTVKTKAKAKAKNKNTKATAEVTMTNTGKKCMHDLFKSLQGNSKENAIIIQATTKQKNTTYNNLEGVNKNVNIMTIIHSKFPIKPIENTQNNNDLNNNNKIVTTTNKEPTTISPITIPILSNSRCQNEELLSSSSILTTIDLTLESTSRALSTTSTVQTPYTKRKIKRCPPYKVIEGTSFAVDAFQFGYLDGVTHYFLTHFHADHYIGLTRKFAQPIYMSDLTGRLVQLFININKEYIRILPLNEEVIIDDTSIAVTALDANHCPGAIMLLFKHLQTGKCTLHTGDFRATYEMEMIPSLWNHNIHTLYLDTTYIKECYAFCTQDESIEKAKQIVQEFQMKNQSKKILYVCGSYMIGKEKFWSALAEEYNWKVWSEENRHKALKAINNEKWNNLLVDNINEAQLHVIAMVKLSYLNLVKYFSNFEHDYDMVLAFRPSGWEKNNKPRFQGKINIIGVEYSEHSNLHEMERFVKFLKPNKVISTVPITRDLFQTSIIPLQWYKYKLLKPKREHQDKITHYMVPKKLNSINTIKKIQNSSGNVAVATPLSKTLQSKTFLLECGGSKDEIGKDEEDNSYCFSNIESSLTNAYIQRCKNKVKSWLNSAAFETNCGNVSMSEDFTKSHSIKVSANLQKIRSSNENENNDLIITCNENGNPSIHSSNTTICNKANENLERTPKRKKVENLTLNLSASNNKSVVKQSAILKNSPQRTPAKRLNTLDTFLSINTKSTTVNYNEDKSENGNIVKPNAKDVLICKNNVNIRKIDSDADDDWLS